MFANDSTYCQDLKLMMVFYHDENCWMPTEFCDAIARANMALRDTKLYRVTKTMVDSGFKAVSIRSFATETEAIDFMLSYDGDGDCLHLVHGQMSNEETIGYVDLWSRNPTFVRLPKLQVYRDCNEAFDDELPF